MLCGKTCITLFEDSIALFEFKKNKEIGSIFHPTNIKHSMDRWEQTKNSIARYYILTTEQQKNLAIFRKI